MSENKIYVGDIGTIILVDTSSDISTATKVSLMVKKGSLDEIEWVAANYVETLQEYVDDANVSAKLTDPEFDGMAPTDNVERRVKYVTVDGDLDVSGKYKVQVRQESPTWTGRGMTFEIAVIDHFK